MDKILYKQDFFESVLKSIHMKYTQLFLKSKHRRLQYCDFSPEESTVILYRETFIIDPLWSQKDHDEFFILRSVL